MNRRQFLATSAVSMVGLSGCVGRTPFGGDDAVTETVTDSFVVGEVDSIRIGNDIGDVTARAGDVDGIDVRVVERSTNGREGLDDINTRLSLDGGVLTVETSIDDSAAWFSRSSPSTDVTVTVPSGDGAPPIDSVTSELGDVTLLNTRGDTTVQTDLGDVTAEGVDGSLDLQSELGEVVAAGTTGIRRAHSELGEVKVEVWGVDGGAEIGTELGDVAVGIVADLAVDVVAESVADIASDLSLTDVERRGEYLSGRLNGGGPEVHVFSELGDVALRSLQRE